MTGEDDGGRTSDLSAGGTANHLFLRFVGSRRAWAAIGVILLAVVVVPPTAKVPVALVLAGVVLAPLLRALQDRPLDADSSRHAFVPGTAIRFEGFMGQPGLHHTRWKQVRCVVEATELRVSSFWKRGTPQVVSIEDAVLTSVSPSGPRDVNLKPGRMRIIEFETRDGSCVRLAVDRSIADAVQEALFFGPGP